MIKLNLVEEAAALATRWGQGHRVARLRSSLLGQRLAQGAFWSGLGGVVSRAATLLGTIAAARLLGREVFGQLSMVQSTVTMFSVLSSFGLGVTATKYVAEHRLQQPTLACSILRTCQIVAWITGSLGTLILVGLAPWLARESLAAPELAAPLRLAAPVLLLGALSATQYGALAGLEAFRGIAISSTQANLILLVSMIAGAWWWGLPGAVASLVVGAAMTWLFQQRSLVRAARTAGLDICQRQPTQWRVLWSYSLPAVFSGIMIGPVNWYCNAMLVNGPAGYREMGAYNAGSQYLTALLFIPIVLSQAVLPMLSERFGARDQTRAMKLMLLSVRINALVVWPLVLLGSLASPWLMRLCGPSFVEAWPTLIVCFLTAGILSLLTPISQVLAATGRMWTGFLMNTGWAITFVVFTWLLVERGALGLALARLIAYALHAAWTCAYAVYLLRTLKDTPWPGAGDPVGTP
jgi:O-antigen/teichoic acid export membrane protein